MGYCCELYVLYPDRIEGTERHVWTAAETIDFGRITRLEKLTGERFRHLVFGPHKRAGICATSVLLSHLYAKTDPARPICAPPIIHVDVDEDGGYAELIARREELIASGTGDLVDLYGPLEAPRRIQLDRVVAHNRHLTLKDDALQWHLDNDWHPVMDAPFIWERCDVLAGWLEEAEARNAIEWTEVSKDPVALALFKARRAYLRELGVTGARALFTFPT